MHDGTAPSDWWKTFFSGVALDFWRRVVPEEATRSEAEALVRILEPRPGARILDVPCGNGRLALDLAARGFEVTGVDLAEEFIGEARAAAFRSGLKVAWRLGDMRDLPWEGAFDAAFCFGNSFGYLDDAGSEEFIHAAARALLPGGRFVLETGAVAETLLPNLRETEEFPAGDIVLVAENRFDRVTRRLETLYHFHHGGRVETRGSSQRVFSLAELESLLARVGFGDFRAFGSAGLERFTPESGRLLLAAGKLRA